MARLRYNGLKTTLGAALTASATSVTFSAALTHTGASGAGTQVPTIAAGDYIALAVQGPGGLAEVVHLTAYTAGATTGTISRGQEGTVGVAHATAARVLHDVTAADVGPASFSVEGGDVSNAGSPTPIFATLSGDSSFATLMYAASTPVMVGDIGSWNSTTSILTVTRPGTYLLTMQIRLKDTRTTAGNFGQNVHTANSDSPTLQWTIVPTGLASSQRERLTLSFSRVVTLPSGAPLRHVVIWRPAGSTVELSAGAWSVTRLSI